MSFSTKPRIAVLLLAAISASAVASGDDLENCRFRGGEPMPSKVCAALRKKAAEDAERLRFNQEQDRLRKEQSEKWQAEQAAIREAQQAERDRQEAAWREEVQERKRQNDKERAESESRAAQQQKAQAALKNDCGSDYRAPSIGMTIQRAQQCVGRFKLVGQINRADGVVSTYVSGATYLHVMNGRVVSWGR